MVEGNLSSDRDEVWAPRAVRGSYAGSVVK